MAPRVRPATTLFVILAVAFAFQMIALLSVPITKNIYLSEYQGIRFGVFGLCIGDKCSGIQVGYGKVQLENLNGFSLPSNARHSVSKLLIVHPIATGFTLILLLGIFSLHWHGPSSSARFLGFLLVWTIPTFLLTLLSFLVDILLFIPHLAWSGWTVLASAVLISLCAILLCIMKRTVSSRKNMKAIGRTNTFDDGYQMRPLNYGVGTVDDLKNGSVEEDESKPFVHDNYNTSYFNDSILEEAHTNDDLNNFPQTQPLNTMRESTSTSRPSHYDTSEVLAPLVSSYRGYDDSNSSNTPKIYDYNTQSQDQDHSRVPIAPYNRPVKFKTPPTDENDTNDAPYPTRIPGMIFDDQDIVSSAPYPANTDLYELDSSVVSKPSGPRPMPGSLSDMGEVDYTGYGESEADDNSIVPLARNSQVGTTEFEFENVESNENTAMPAEDVDVSRQLTFRTKIANTLDKLQPAGMYSNSSFERTDENLPNQDQRKVSALRDIVEYDTTEDSTVSDDSATKDDSQVDTHYLTHEDSSRDELLSVQNDVSSSVYSSTANPSMNPTPVQETFPINQTSQPINPVQNHLDRQRRTGQFQPIPEQAAINSIKRSPLSSEYMEEYPLPDPNEKRSTPAPSFTNESILSSTFTSVSQREINPKYLEKHNPEEYRRYLQRNLQQQEQAPYNSQNITGSTVAKTSAADILISSNPDFSLNVSPKRRR